MNLELSSDQKILADMLARVFKKRQTLARNRELELTGHDDIAWKDFSEMGLGLMRVPEGMGGSGASLMDAVVVVETLGAHLPLIPAIEAMVASRVLALLGWPLDSLLQGDIVTLALDDAHEANAQQVLGAPVAKHIVFRAGDEVRLANGPLGQNEPSHSGQATATVALAPDTGTLIAKGERATSAWEAAIAEWKLLSAAFAAAAARAAIDLAAEYARERSAFGQLIGSYQGLAHPLAEASVHVDGARLLVWRAVTRIAHSEPGAEAMPFAAFWWSATASRRAAILAMRVFGGYGMSLEHDAQLYFRHINHRTLLSGNPDAELDNIAKHLWRGKRTALPEVGEVPISFDYPASALKAAARVRQIFADHVTDTRKKWQFESDDFLDRDLFRMLARENLLYPDWPEELGGGGFDAFSVSAIRGVFAEFDWDHVIVSVSDMLGKMVQLHGSAQAKSEILPRLASGEAFAALGYSEPSCGSDIFDVRTRAVREGDYWLIDGQKMFTSQGHFADYVILLTRTGESKHGGITLFAMPTELPGYDCHEIRTVGGERTNSTFYEGVKLHDDYRLGEVNGGAKVLAQLLAMEHGAGDHFHGALRSMLDAVLEWANDADGSHVPPIQSADVQRCLAATFVKMEVADVLIKRTVEAFGNGRARKHFGPSAKLFGSEAWVSCGSDLMALTAPHSLLRSYSPLGRLERQFRRSVPSTIYAGTSEVQRSIIAESGLKLPRTRG